MICGNASPGVAVGDARRASCPGSIPKIIDPPIVARRGAGANGVGEATYGAGMLCQHCEQGGEKVLSFPERRRAHDDEVRVTAPRIGEEIGEIVLEMASVTQKKR